jgi:hypothetical protein
VAAQHSDTPAWLFSFVDLAFLILLMMTQVGSLDSQKGLDLGELVVPRVGENAPAEAMSSGASVTQVRVYPPGDALPVFELVPPGAPAVRVDRVELRARLLRLRAASADRPVLAPHADSRSEDLLAAVGLVEDVWPSDRRAMVQRIEAPR